LSYRIAQNVDKQRATCLTEESLDAYFELVRKKMNDLGLNEKPSNIFNCDETGISADQGKKKVFFKKGDRSPNVISGANEKQHYTIQVTT
jgi:hypothetical protein